jgi:serine/threonine protein kinase
MDAPTERNAPQPQQQPYPSAQLGHVLSAVRALEHPTQIGPYAILALVGEGGMGSVYKAEQRAPIRRTVALKIIKLGMDTREVIARFESERQALALMDHPNVAKVLDAGATDTGRPYFVMEFVAGEPITKFADRHRLTLRQRLELFIPVCEAIQHAHQKAIIHRDLKPSNILVTLQDDRPRVKVIDFGVAKAISQRLTEKTLFTETGHLVGTPEYMAPEQAEGNAALDVDTRTDVYSLGVVLYELLSGALPFDAPTLRSKGFNEIQRIIRDVDPPRPSTKLSGLKGSEEVARLRRTPLEALQHQLKSELEWIPLKAMRNDRSERYATTAELAQDIQNYLANRPLRAGPESAAYRARKFLRRNKAGVAASAAMVLLLIAGIAATTWQAVRATRAQRATRAALLVADQERKQAQDARASAEAVNEFLTNDMLRSADPAEARGRKVTVVEALDAAANRVGSKFKDRPLLEAAVRDTLGSTYDALGEPSLGLPHAQRAFDQRRQLLGQDHPDTLRAMNTLVGVLLSAGKLREAEPLAHQAADRARRLFGPGDRVTLSALANLGALLQMQSNATEAERVYRDAADAARKSLGDEDGATLAALHNLASALQNQRRSAEAEALFRQLLVVQHQVLGDDHPDTVNTKTNLAMTLLDQGKLDESERLCRETLAANRRLLGDDRPRTVLSMRNLAAVLETRGQLDEAEKLYRDALSATRRVLGEDHLETFGAMNNLASVLKKQGQIEQAIELHRDVLARCRRSLDQQHAYTIYSLNNLGQSLSAADRRDEAEPLFAELYRLAPAAHVDAGTAAVCMSRWGPCLAALRRYTEAEQPLREAYRRLRETGQSNGPVMAGVVRALARVCDETNRPDEAAQLRAELQATTREASPRPATAP